MRLGDALGETGEHVVAEIHDNVGEATYVNLDVTSEAAWRDAVALAERTYSKLNVLVNNAGILLRARIAETTKDDFERIMAVNLKGAFMGHKACHSSHATSLRRVDY